MLILHLALILSGPALRRHYLRIGYWLNRVAGDIMILLSLDISAEARRGQGKRRRPRFSIGFLKKENLQGAR
ncbi:hypothetical protein [Martelella soudanensis]|uniref:hypothetical protein n=1 Tax=unclassified Martelella TaxID=2629616 RepID=UPI0015DECD2A|nr:MULTISPECIES: hypothetical protein [unclassified Martelella]